VRIATVTREYAWERPSTLVHMALPADWAAAQEAGEYRMSTRGVTLEQEGFIHCSFDHQVVATANRFYGDLDALVLLRIDPTLLAADVVVEPPFPGAVDHFPHVYGPIPLAAVIETTAWHRTGDAWV
jgi:glutathione S-transferase